MTELTDEILAACLAMGFAGAGVCRAEPSARSNDLETWLDEGRHGSMVWMEERREQRVDPRRLIGPRGEDGAPAAEARSLIMVADQYADGAEAAEEASRAPDADPPRGKVARYARGRDYHAVVRKRLHALADRLRERYPQAGFRAFVDTGPVLERELAVKAGLGFVGKNTLLIDPRAGGGGSWVVLGGLATTLSLRATTDEHLASDHCGSCTRCIDACPTGAIEPYRVDARRCISYLTIEHEGVIPRGLARQMGAWVFGCDICQEVCPFNAPHGGGASTGATGSRVNPLYRSRPGLREGVALEELLDWSEDDRRVKLTVSASKRANLEMLRRNAVIAAENSRRPELRERVRAIGAEDPGLAGRQARELMGEGDQGSGSIQ